MKVLFVGLGGVGQRHLRNLKSLLGDNVEIYAYRKRKQQFVLDNKLNIKDGFNLDEVYNIKNVDSLDKAFEENIDVVFITNPTSMHMEVLLEASKRNCDIFIEKPISHNLHNIEEVQENILKNNNILFVAYQNRFHPCIKKTKELIEDKAIGDVIAMNSEIGEDLRAWHKYEDYRGMYASRKELGGGVVLSQIHELDYINWFLGMPESVFSVGGKLSNLDIDVEDTVSTILRYDFNGKKVPVHIHQDYVQTPPSRTCKVIGTKGKIEVDLLKSSINVFDVDGKEIFNNIYEFDRNDMFIDEMKEFLNNIQKQEKASISIEDGINSLKIALAIKESMSTGCIVDINKK